MFPNSQAGNYWTVEPSVRTFVAINKLFQKKTTTSCHIFLWINSFWSSTTVWLLSRKHYKKAWDVLSLRCFDFKSLFRSSVLSVLFDLVFFWGSCPPTVWLINPTVYQTDWTSWVLFTELQQQLHLTLALETMQPFCLNNKYPMELIPNLNLTSSQVYF